MSDEWVFSDGSKGTYTYQAPNAPASSDVTIDFEAEAAIRKIIPTAVPGMEEAMAKHLKDIWRSSEEVTLLRELLAELREIKERLPSL